MIEVYKVPSKVDILVFGVHPDDIELSCAGTVLKHLGLGYAVGLADLTCGELGSRGNASLRIEESRRAAELMEVNFRVNLEMADGFFRNDEAHIHNIIRIIRLSQPGIVLANAIDDRHPDHGRAAKLVADAFFYSGLRKIEVDGLTVHRPKALYHYIQDKRLNPDFCVDVTGYEQKKMDAIACFSSQFHTGQQDDGPKTPISTASFMDFIKSKMVVFGRPIGADYAEGFNIHRTLGIGDLGHLI